MSIRVMEGMVYLPEDSSGVSEFWQYTTFGGLQNAVSIDMKRFNTSRVRDMSGMFYNCAGLQTLDLSGLDTSNVTEMQEMFAGCTGLTSLNLSSFDTSNVTNMSFTRVRKLSLVKLAHALVYRGRLWRLNYGALNFDRDMPVSWAYSDWMFQEYEGMDGLTKLITDTKDDFGINVEGLVKYLQEHGLNIRDIGYWTGVNPERYFEEHPDVDSISTSWDAEAEVLFPLIKNNYCIL